MCLGDCCLKEGVRHAAIEAGLRLVSAELAALKASLGEPVAWIYTSKLAGSQKFMTRFASDLSTYQADKVTKLYAITKDKP